MLKNRFKNILVALDGSINSTRGMNEAISLARQCKGSITGIYVLPSLPSESTISVSYRQYLSRAIASEVNVSLSEVSPSAEKSVEMARMLWLPAHIAEENGYLVYNVFVTDSNGKMHKIIIDLFEGNNLEIRIASL